ncbi:DUF6538 domain-containing protein [Comamonas sp. GCA5]
MPRLAPYLQRRGSGFTFRISVPPELRQLIGAREFTRALSETNHEAASPTALEFAAAAKRLFYEVRAMTGREINHDRLQLVVAKLRRKLDREDAEERVQEVERLHALELQRLERLREDAVRVARLEAENAALLKALEAQQRPIHVEVAQAVPAEQPLVATALTPPAKQAPTLRAVVDAFLAQYEKRGKPQMLKKHRPALNMLVEVVGDKPVNELRQADINEFFDVLTVLPPRWSDQCRKLKLSVRELAELEHEETIGPKTFQDSYIASVRPFLEAAQRDYGDQGFPLTLTTKGIEYLGDQEEDVNKQRAFKPAELVRLFAGPELQGFAADPTQHDKYWLPMLGLFTGARVNELCQLNPQMDIVQDAESGVWHLWINAVTEADKGIRKSVKTGDSRKVPVHKTLLALGFVEHVTRLKAAGARRLFPSWKPSKGRASGEAEKWFRQFLRDVGLWDDTPKAKLLGMHAFRHTLLSYGTASKPSLNLGSITGHAQVVPGVSAVQAGYNDESITNKLEDRQALLDQLDYGIEFVAPTGLTCVKSVH